MFSNPISINRYWFLFLISIFNFRYKHYKQIIRQGFHTYMLKCHYNLFNSFISNTVNNSNLFSMVCIYANSLSFFFFKQTTNVTKHETPSHQNYFLSSYLHLFFTGLQYKSFFQSLSIFCMSFHPFAFLYNSAEPIGT